MSKTKQTWYGYRLVGVDDYKWKGRDWYKESNTIGLKEMDFNVGDEVWVHRCYGGHKNFHAVVIKTLAGNGVKNEDRFKEYKPIDERGYLVEYDDGCRWIVSPTWIHAYKDERGTVVSNYFFTLRGKFVEEPVNEYKPKSDDSRLNPTPEREEEQ